MSVRYILLSWAIYWISLISQAAVIDVSVTGSDFSPDPEINVGDTIRWIWTSDFHTSQSVSGIAESWNSGYRGQGSVFTHTFTTAGVFHYYCDPHGWDNGNGTADGMAGIITVVAPPPPPPQVELLKIADLQVVSPVGLKPTNVSPVSMTHAGDGSGRIFINDQRGRIYVLKDDMILPTPYLDMEYKLTPPPSSFDERGLLGLVFHPDFENSGTAGEGKFYVYYSAPSPNAPGTGSAPVDHMSVIEEYTVSDPAADVASFSGSRIILSFNEPQFNHNAGQLAFGSDGMLYISVGDGGSSDDNNAGHSGGSSTKPSGVLGNAQDKTNLLGKVLRIDPFGTNGPAGVVNAAGTYGIPADNPFVAQGGGVREEIYAYGLRNPWRFSFDDGPGGTGRLFLGDVGQGSVEEVNIITSGGNYGWRNKEGSTNFDATAPGVGPFVGPIAEYAHPGVVNGMPQIGTTVIGGYVYRGTANTNLVGSYIFADWSNGSNGVLMALDEPVPNSFNLEVFDVVGSNPLPAYIQAIGEDESGELYILSKPDFSAGSGNPGVIYKIAETSAQLTRYQQWHQTYFVAGEYIDLSADEDADGVVNLIEYALNLDPQAGDGSSLPLLPSGSLFFDGTNHYLRLTFRRDPRATDVTYRVQSSGDLKNWTSIATSVNGAAPTGTTVISDTEISGEAPMREVIVQDFSAITSSKRRFLRLQVER